MSIDEQQEVAEPAVAWSTIDPRKRRRDGLRGFRLTLPTAPRRRPPGSPILVLSFAWVVFVLLLAILANWLPIRNPILPLGIPNASPHWGREFLGYDAIGRSMVSRLVYGARTSYLIAICTTAVAMCIGCAIGLLAAYFRGTMNFVADLFCNVILSIPGLLLLLTIACVVRPSYGEVIWSIAIVILPGFIRITRAIALTQMEQSYISSARALGASPTRIIVHELLPNTLVSLVTYAGIVLPHVMIVEGGLSYLGYGVPLPTSSWGEMIALGQPNLSRAPWQVLIPAILFAVNVFALYTITDWLRAKVDLKGVDVK